MCLFCTAVSSAQNSTFIDKWERQARSRAASWNSYTRTATAANRPTYTSLYVNEKIIASFSDAGTCRAKISELKKLAENMYGKQSRSSSSSRSNSSIGKGGQATRDLERMTGVNLNEMARASNALDGLKAEADAKIKQKILSQIEGYCSCRTENNPNYDPNTKPGDFGYADLFTSNDNEKTDNENPSNSPFADNPQTQYENIFDAPSARTPQHTNTSEEVSLNFEHLETSARSTGRGIRVGNTNWKSDWQTPVEQEEISTNSMEEYGKWREKINSQPFDMEVLQYNKRQLELQYDEVAKNCDKFSEFACLNELKTIADKIDVLQKRMDGRTEWLDKVNNMSNEILVAQERNTAKAMEMAGLAAASYANYEERGGIPKGWTNETSSTGFETVLLKTNNEGIKSGFHCELFKNEDGNYVLSFRGTDNIRDVVKAWGQGNFYFDEQTQSALKITEDIIKELEDRGIPREKLQLTGHSLGGRLAAEAAIEYGLTAYTFNSADVSLETRKGEKTGKSGNIINTVSANDFLTASTFGLGKPDGGINYNWSSNLIETKKTAGIPYVDKAKTMTNITKEVAGIRTGTYSPGYTNVVKEVYGNGQIDGHDILLLRRALEQRHQDIVNEKNNRAQ